MPLILPFKLRTEEHVTQTTMARSIEQLGEKVSNHVLGPTEPDIELVAFIPLLHKAILDSNVLGARRVGSVCNHVDRRLVVTEQHGLEDGV